MDELDNIWPKMLEKAIADARDSGRHDVADYLSLKAANDEIRRGSVRWLFDSAIEIAAEANRDHTALTIERQEPHSFAFSGANMVGSLVRFRQGLRCLTIEAGWTRTPKDGFMRGGALAHARFVHFGLPGENEELFLVITSGAPQWQPRSPAAGGPPFMLDDLRRHFRVFQA